MNFTVVVVIVVVYGSVISIYKSSIIYHSNCVPKNTSETTMVTYGFNNIYNGIQKIELRFVNYKISNPYINGNVTAQIYFKGLDRSYT